MKKLDQWEVFLYSVDKANLKCTLQTLNSNYLQKFKHGVDYFFIFLQTSLYCQFRYIRFLLNDAIKKTNENPNQTHQKILFAKTRSGTFRYSFNFTHEALFVHRYAVLANLMLKKGIVHEGLPRLALARWLSVYRVHT